jgi:DNA-binding NarL/FixJ family response regulator
VNDLRLVVADDQAAVRDGLVLLLGTVAGIDVVASAANGREAIDAVAAHRPDAILLDLHMPVLDGVDAARILTAEHPDVAIVVLTTYVDDTSVLAALRAGARGYLTKDTDRADIAAALRGAVSGLSVLDPQVRAALLESPRPSTTLPDGLTQREAEILLMIAAGKTNPEIARELVLSGHTVKTHVNRIFTKTGSRDRAAAIRYAAAHGLTQPDSH